MIFKPKYNTIDELLYLKKVILILFHKYTDNNHEIIGFNTKNKYNRFVIDGIII